jgi:predicted PurR-regulated permease PerM
MDDGHTVHNEHNFITAKALTFALIAGVVLLVVPFLPGLIGAGVTYVVARPVVDMLDPPRRGRIAPFITMFAVFVVLVIPGVWLIMALLAQIPDAAESLQHSAAVARLMALQLGDINVGSLLNQASSEIIGWSSRQTMTAISGIVSATINLIIALFGAYYMLTSSDELWKAAKAALPFPPATSELLRTRFHQVTDAMLIGVVLTGATQALLVGVTFAILGIQQPVLWGAVTAVASLLPMFGSALVWFPAVLILIAREQVAGAVILAFIGVVLISNIDNALRLAVYRRVSKVHPMVTLVGAFAGVHAFGLAGLLLGPLVLSYMLELLKIYRANGAVILETPAGAT